MNDRSGARDARRSASRSGSPGRRAADPRGLAVTAGIAAAVPAALWAASYPRIAAVLLATVLAAGLLARRVRRGVVPAGERARRDRVPAAPGSD